MECESAVPEAARSEKPLFPLYRLAGGDIPVGDDGIETKSASAASIAKTTKTMVEAAEAELHSEKDASIYLTDAYHLP